jgi:hypothetical protein
MAMEIRKPWAVLLLLFVALLVILWWGVPTYRKAKADALVDELCAKDGGIKVYETVRLPASRFDQYGNVPVPSIKTKKTDDEYYYATENTWIVRGTTDPTDLAIWRGRYELYRSSDGKKLGESTYYARSGGDPPSPAHPSSYRCPKELGVEKKVFVTK